MGKKRKNMKKFAIVVKILGVQKENKNISTMNTLVSSRYITKKQANRKPTNEKGVPNLWFSTPKYMKKISLYQSS